MGLNLIVETPAPKEEFEYIVEEGNSKDKQNFYIKDRKSTRLNSSHRT